MSVFTIIGAGMMGSAMSFPLRDNGHEVRIVGTPLDEAVVEGLRRNDFHINMKRTLPGGIRYFQIGELAEAMEGTDFFIGGVSSSGVEWFAGKGRGPFHHQGAPGNRLRRAGNLPRISDAPG